MTREEKQKAIDALKISVPVMAMTQEEFNDYIQTLNKVMDWLEREPTTKNDLGVEKIVDVLGSYTDLDIPYKHKIAEDILNNLPSVTPQERKGHWIVREDNTSFVKQLPRRWVECSHCGWSFSYDRIRDDYCSKCGADMRADRSEE